MQNVKQHLLDFFEAESNAVNLERIPELEPYNQAVEKMYSYTTGLLNEGLGIVSYEELESERYYERVKGVDPHKPAKLFKISHYKHSEFEDVWVAYCSLDDSPLNKLSVAYFVIKEDDKLAIARRYSWTNFEAYTDEEVYEKEGLANKWLGAQGYSRLTFESLGELVSIERYQVPDDVEESLALYHEEK